MPPLDPAAAPAAAPAPTETLAQLQARQATEVDVMKDRHDQELASLTAAAATPAVVDDHKAKQKAEADALAARHADERAAAGAAPDEGPDPNASSDAIAAPQLLAAKGDLLLNGPAAVAGTVTMRKRRRVVITSAGDDRGINWTVTGTAKTDGPVITDTFAGANASDVRSSVDFLTVSKVSGSGASADHVAVGVGALPPQWEPIDEGAVLAVAQAMAQAHHGEDVADVGGYMEPARSFVAAARGFRDYSEAQRQKPAPAPSAAPKQGAPAPAKPAPVA